MWITQQIFRISVLFPLEDKICVIFKRTICPSNTVFPFLWHVLAITWEVCKPEWLDCVRQKNNEVYSGIQKAISEGKKIPKWISKKELLSKERQIAFLFPLVSPITFSLRWNIKLWNKALKKNNQPLTAIKRESHVKAFSVCFNG